MQSILNLLKCNYDQFQIRKFRIAIKKKKKIIVFRFENFCLNQILQIFLAFLIFI